MARLKHPQRGTEIEVDDKTAEGYRRRGWEVVGDADDKPAGRRKSSRKAADDR